MEVTPLPLEELEKIAGKEKQITRKDVELMVHISYNYAQAHAQEEPV